MIDDPIAAVRGILKPDRSPVNDGGPAFPISIPGVGDNGMGGMTLRDWFAGQALAGLLAADTDWDGPADAAREAYQAADAMLKAREA